MRVMSLASIGLQQPQEGLEPSRQPKTAAVWSTNLLILHCRGVLLLDLQKTVQSIDIRVHTAG